MSLTSVRTPPVAQLKLILARAIKLDRADKGNIQMLDAAGDLRIVAQRGFKAEFLRHFAVVKRSDSSVCGRALNREGCIMVPDVGADPLFAPHLHIAVRAGFRSVKSVPLIDAEGTLRGMLSTHSAAIRWDWERDNTRALALKAAELLAACSRGLARPRRGAAAR